MKSTAVVYKSGNSRVVTLPAWTGLEIGDEVRLKKSDDGVVLEKAKVRAEKTEATNKLKRLSGLAPGSTKGLEKVEDLEEFLEGVYD